MFTFAEIRLHESERSVYEEILSISDSDWEYICSKYVYCTMLLWHDGSIEVEYHNRYCTLLAGRDTGNLLGANRYFMPADYSEAVTFDGAVYCTSCLDPEIDPETDPDVFPIFACSEWDYYPVCDVCHEVHEYVSLTDYGRHYEGYRECSWCEGEFRVDRSDDRYDMPESDLLCEHCIAHIQSIYGSSSYSDRE